MQSPGRQAKTFAELLQDRAATHRDRRAYLYLRDGEVEEASLTYGQLHERALGVATRLQQEFAVGDRAILLYPAGLDFIVAFFGCLYAGVVPVPVSVPNRKRGVEIIRGIAVDCGARVILSSEALLSRFEEVLAADQALGPLPRFNTESWPSCSSSSEPPFRSATTDVALLQYTSGSTGSPRGVVVTHGNLMENQREHEACFGNDADTVWVSWLPMFHDMGLGTVLGAVWLGVECVLMAPTAFLQKPIRWLRAISRYRATSSGGPDFAYDLCVRRIANKECDDLNLSSWRVAYNGSEPVRASTLQRFTQAFGPYGFRPTAFLPVYGLAEATLFVSGGKIGTPPIVCRFSPEGLERGEGKLDSSSRSKPLVGCGAAWHDARIQIVHPETKVVCSPGEIGEIWVAGPSIASGYWQKPAETAEVFNASTASGDGPFLRTGDLGFEHAGNLFITGRYKDLIIIRGRNHYPQDIEGSVSESHAALEPLAAAAFSVDSEDGEQLVIVQEVKRTSVHRLDAEPVFRTIRSVVAERHGVHAHTIVLISPGHLPRTTSGKVRRKTCRRAFLDNALPSLAASVFGAEALESSGSGIADAGDVPLIPGAERAESADSLSAATRSMRSAKSANDVIEWLRNYAQGALEPTGSDVLRGLPAKPLLDLSKQGLLGMQVDERYGGLGLSHTDTARVLEQLAAIDLNAGLFVGLNNYLGVGPIASHAAPSLKESLMPRLARGGALAGFAFAEPGIGSNPDALAAYAEPINGTGWRLFGNKYKSGGSSSADGVITVFTRHSDRNGVSAFVLPQDSVGSGQSGGASMSSTLGFGSTPIVLSGVPLRKDHMLGRPGDGIGIAVEAMSYARLAVASACLGGMKRCAQLVFHYSTQRQAATGRLVAHPVTLAKLGRVTAGIAALESLIQKIAGEADAARQVPSEAFTVCKVVAPEMLWQAVDDLVQLLGRRGFVETPHIRHLVRDAQALRCQEGPAEAMLSLIGGKLLTGGAESLSRLAGEILGSQRAASIVSRAVEAAQGRLQKSSHFVADDEAFWTNARAGEVVTWIVLLAAIEGSVGVTSNGDLARAQKWAEANVERTLSMLQSELPSDVTERDSGITESVVAYSKAIGNADPILLWDENALNPLLSGDAPGSSERPPSLSPASVSSGAQAFDKHGRGLRKWIVTWLAVRLRVAESQIDAKQSFADHGVDSLAAVELAKALSDHLGRSLDETLLWNFATIDALVQFLDSEPRGQAGGQRASSVPPKVWSRPSSEVTQADLADAIAELEAELKKRS